MTPQPGRLAWWIASGGGVGLFPSGPGTAASAMAVLVGFPVLRASPWWIVLAILAAAAAGWWAILNLRALHDPGWVVIDEFAGQWLALLGLSGAGAVADPRGAVLAFVLFRMFDIAKPGPIGWLDRRKGVAWTAMADDLAAGAAAGALTWLAVWAWPGLFG